MVPVVVYYAAFAGFVAISKVFYEFRVFAALGPLAVGPDSWLSFLTAAVLVVASAVVGRYCLAHGDNGIADSFFLASLGSSASIGAYLSCYTLLNPVLRIAFVAVLAFVAFRAWALRNAGLFERFARPLWITFACLGVATIAVWDWAVTPVHFELHYPDVQESRYLAAHMETATLFFDEDAWARLSMEEKASALGEMVLVECNYLGIEKPPAVAVSARPSGTVASYSAEENLVTFNPSYLVTERDGVEALEAAAHETAHCYQAECVKRGYALPASMSGWAKVPPNAQTIAKWEREFRDYTPASIDVERYSDQDCERTAYSYGRSSRRDVERRVAKYCATGNPYE